LITVDSLTKHFGEVSVLNGLSFELLPGEILGFLGPNGAGKTTTMRILTCFFPPTSGRATVAGFDVTREPDEVRRALGYLPEGVPLYRDMTVLEFLDFIAQAKGVEKSRRASSVDQAIDETNLGEWRRRTISELSRGTRQRVGLAQAILGEPKVLILDEPTVGLDPQQIAEIRQLILGMKGRRTVLLSTHILPEVQMTCDRVIILNKGRIAAQGTPDHLTGPGLSAQELELLVEAPLELVEKTLRSITGVTDLRLEPEASGTTRAHLKSEDPAALRALVSRALTSQSHQGQPVALLEMKLTGRSLEQAFLEAIGRDVAHASGVVAA
jgi:ABC-2 type transport system ATP-binding protein